MKGLESGKDKVKKICDVLKRETLEPAKREAEEIVTAARRTGDEILADARVEAEKMIEEARLEIEKQKMVFKASLAQACRQAIEALKEKIETKLFNPELSHLVTKGVQDPKLIAQMIDAVVKAIEKTGIETDLSATIASTVSARAVNELLASHVVARLKEKGVLLSAIGGGIEVKLIKDQMTIDLTDATLKEMVANYIRKDFREYIFG